MKKIDYKLALFFGIFVFSYLSFCSCSSAPKEDGEAMFLGTLNNTSDCVFECQYNEEGDNGVTERKTILLAQLHKDNKVIEISSYNIFHGVIGDVIVPEKIEYDGRKFIVTDTYSFGEQRLLKSISLPNTIKEKNYRFYYCDSLTTVKLPDSTKYISGLMFENCLSLTDIVIPDGVEEIGCGAFRNCQKLEEITIPKSVKTIFGDCGGLFEGCTNLKVIRLSRTAQFNEKQLGINERVRIEYYD